MSTLSIQQELPRSLPDHTQLPETDGTFVNNDQEHPQSMLLTDSIRPVLLERYPDGRYCIGQDLGIYWRLMEPPEPLERGATAPDWFFVPNVPRTLGGKMRRSYVLWQEWVAPRLVLEFVSGNGSEEWDPTPVTGKLWIYEQAIRAPYYGIYEVAKASVKVNQLVGGRYQLMEPNARGHYEIESMGVELGIWQGIYQEVALPWLRWWDPQGNLLLTGEERAAKEMERAAKEMERAERELKRAERLAAQLRALGVEPQE